MLAAAAGLAYFGVGGYRLGWVWVGAVLVVGSGGAVWWALGTGVERRGMWVASAAVFAVVGGSVLVDAAPPSAGVLQQRLDGLTLPFYEVIDQNSGGGSTCRPACPRVTRVLRSPVGSVEAAAGEVRAAVNRHPELPTLKLDELAATGEDVRVDVEFETGVEEGVTVIDVRITLESIAGL